ncbi:MAG: PspC domain-containing protein, partial [Microbispora sp.]|nr:PspC domain-containing protein [Microbispora sp.]
MTEAPPTPAPDPAGTPAQEKALSRSNEGRMITGVCAGLGRFTGMDPVLFRVGFAVLVLASGIGVLLYVAAYLLMRRPGGAPGHLEQWTRRLFDAETVLALLAAVFAFGLIINVASGGINRGTIVVGTLLAIVLMAAHARGVDLLTMAKSMPERATGRRGMTRATPNFAPFAPFTPPAAREPYGAKTPAAETPLRETPAPGAAHGDATRAPVTDPADSGPAGENASGPAGDKAGEAAEDTTAHAMTAREPAAGDTTAPQATADDTAADATTAETSAAEETTAPQAAADDTASHDTIIQGPVAEDGTPKGAAADDTLVQEPVRGHVPPAGRADGNPPTRPFERLAHLAAEPAPDTHPTTSAAPGPYAPGAHVPGPDAGRAYGAPEISAGATGYRRLSDLAREARAGAYGYGGARNDRYDAGGHAFGSGEPFAPHGPYTIREPYGPYGAHYAPGPY